MNKHAQELGRLGGLVRSEAKTKAVRENGKKGGRPKKVCEHKTVRKTRLDWGTSIEEV